MQNISKKLLIVLLFASFAGKTQTQAWDIPANKKAKNSFLPFTKELATEGENLYNKNCQSCHGNPSKNNGQKAMQPPPPDLAEKQTNDRTDGDIFFILSTGRNAMPNFKGILSEEDRWKLISYLRSFHKNYTQVLSKVDPAKSKLVRFSLNLDTLKAKMWVTVFAAEAGGAVPLKNDEVGLFVNRYFGKLPIGKPKNTDEQGKVCFDFPKDIPCDATGNLSLVVNVNDDLYGEVETADTLKAGKFTYHPPLNEKRAIWNVLSKAPFWVIFTYTGIMMLVTGVIIFILLSLKRLKAAGKS